jgi:TetR/AcrR family transcriptional repressor of nem operon
LVRSATDLLYRHGVDSPTLTEIAHKAGVPPGNVYYYFKTRDELVESVIDARADGLRQLLDSLDRRSSPRARLKALARVSLDNRADIAANGCPIGTLCSSAGSTHSPAPTSDEKRSPATVVLPPAAA